MGQVTNSAVMGLGPFARCGSRVFGFCANRALPTVRTADGPDLDVSHFKGGRNYDEAQRRGAQLRLTRPYKGRRLLRSKRLMPTTRCSTNEPKQAVPFPAVVG